MAKGRNPAAKGKVAPPRVAARRLTPKGEATRSRLIELAGDIFAEEGYAAASTRDIAHRSGLSSGAIYGTFRGKADLLAASLRLASSALGYPRRAASTEGRIRTERFTPSL